MLFAKPRRKLAHWIYPVVNDRDLLITQGAKALAMGACHVLKARFPAVEDVGDVATPTVPDAPGQNVISSLLVLADEFQQSTALSDWEVASRAGVNNRAIKILRGGSPVSPSTAARLFEYFEEAWPDSVVWPLDASQTRRFGTILTIPVIERVGGAEAMLALIQMSGRKRTKGAVLSWAGRSGMPDYARTLARNECLRIGASLNEADFEPARLTPAEVTKLRPSKSKKEAA